MKFFFGPMSKNVVDVIIEFANKYERKMTFIPSRRQIEYNGGYVNNWTIEEFVKYVKARSTGIMIERDHGGPQQGSEEDDGYDSLIEDVKYMDIIHIDPWKAYPILEQGLHQTINMINLCYSLNPNLEYEVGTEEAIRPYSVEEFDLILNQLQSRMQPYIFNKIKYAVIQCGTKLSEGSNIGTFNGEKLIKMIDVTNKYGLIAKEHNGDWVDLETHSQKESLGLTCVNIAPEMAKIESAVILNRMKENGEDFEKLYTLCLDSGKWKKWVSHDFDYKTRKEEIILIAAHYIFSNSEFIELKKKYQYIDAEIQNRIYEKLIELHNIPRNDSYFISNIVDCKYISNAGFLLKCDELNTITYTSSIVTHDFSKISKIKNDRTIIAVKFESIGHFIHEIMPQIVNKFILVTCDGDSTIPYDLLDSNTFLRTINDERIIHWYSVNCLPVHPKLSIVPLGMNLHSISLNQHRHWNWADSKEMSPKDVENKLIEIQQQAQPFYNRKVQCYSNFHFSMYSEFGNPRQRAINEIPRDLIFYEPNFIKPNETWNNQTEYAFVVSPMGHGMDCHRTWEALILGCIVIVKTSVLDLLYEGLPVLIVDEWFHITKELLEKTIVAFKDKQFEYERLTSDWWIEKIKRTH